jgi:hypothetical protein
MSRVRPEGRATPGKVRHFRPPSIRVTRKFVPSVTDRFRTTTVCGGLVALALAGCGGSSRTSTSGTLSKSEFVSQANAICARVNSAQSSIGTPTSTAQAVSAITKLESAVGPDLAQMQRLAARAPREIKADYDRFVAQVGSLVALLPGIAQAAKNNDSAKIQQLQTQFQTLVNQGKVAAKSAGLGSACTQ